MRNVHSGFNVLKIANCSNILPFTNRLYEQDKEELAHSNGMRVVFDLDTVVCKSGNNLHPLQTMSSLKRRLMYPHLIWAFKLFDSDNDGVIVYKEIEAMSLLSVEPNLLQS